MKLEVPFVRGLKKWKGNGWCGPLSFASVLRYYGFQDSVEEIAKECKAVKGVGTTIQSLINFCLNKGMRIIYFSENNFVDENNSNYTSDMRKFLKEAKASKFEKEFYNKNKKFENFVHYKKKAKIKDIERFIESGKPVIIVHNVAPLFGKNLLWPHYIVIVGFDKDNFYIHNVAIKNQRFQKVNKEVLKKSWNCGGIKNILIVPFMEKHK